MNTEQNERVVNRMRTVDADAIISRIKPIIEAERQIYNKASWNFAEKCLTVVESAPTVSAEPDWTPCKEAYPKEAGRYLVTIRGYIDDELEIGLEYYSPYSEFYMRKWKSMNIIAWANTLELYQGE